MKTFTSLAVSSLLLLIFFLGEDSVLFQSFESRTVSGQPVMNHIRFFQREGRDIWMMKQKHENTWDRLAIVVDKKLQRVSYLQLPPGELEWSEDLPGKKIKERVSCLMCHANGPRAIRPQGKVGFLSKVQIVKWNFRMKSYGRLKHDAQINGQKHRDVLTVETCQKCHKEEGWFARGALGRENSITIDFLVKNDLMPPRGFTLTEEERRQVEDFVMGF